MERNPLANDIRKDRRRRRLPPNATCVCGENRPEALEIHHPAGRANEPDLVAVLCKNCHAAETEAQLDAGVNLSHDLSLNGIERLPDVLLGVAVYLASLAEHLFSWAQHLQLFITWLNGTLPEWRDWDKK